MNKKNYLRKISSASVDNDLSFYAAILSEIDYVVSQTYGPEAGYVAQHVPDNGGGSFTYTKDGLTTLNSLVMDERADQYVLNMVKELANVIKKTSGDGSTTATKLIYYLVKYAFEKSKEKDLYKYRINTPKAIEVIIKLFTEEMNKWTVSIDENSSIDEKINLLKHAAKISLNNDETLMGPINKLFDHLKENNAAIDKTLKIEAYKSYNDETDVTNNTGYLVGVKNFSIDTELMEVQNAKVVILPTFLSTNMLYFVINHIMNLAQEFSKGIKIIFIVNAIEDQIKVYFKNKFRELQTKDTELLFDIIELESAYTTTESKLEDISYLLNAQIIMLNDYVELRDTIIPGSDIDNPNTTNMVKWKAANKPVLDEQGNKVGEEFDVNYYRDIFTDVYLDNLVNSFFCDVKYINNLGITLTPSKYAIDNQIKPEHKELLNKHIARLKSRAESTDLNVANDAKFRLYSLQDNLHVINVAKRIVDDERLFTAYKDAAKALTSIASHGYYMGGSVGLYIVLSETYDVFMRVHHNKDVLSDTVKLILELLIKSVESIIQDLKYEFQDKSFNTIREEGHINFDDDSIDGVPVIVPVETDLVMVPNVLYLFSNIFASLLINFTNTTDSGRAKYVAAIINKDFEKKEDKVVEEEKPEEPVVTDEVVEVEEDIEVPNEIFEEEDDEENTPYHEVSFEDEDRDMDDNYEDEPFDAFDDTNRTELYNTEEDFPIEYEYEEDTSFDDESEEYRYETEDTSEINDDYPFDEEYKEESDEDFLNSYLNMDDDLPFIDDEENVTYEEPHEIEEKHSNMNNKVETKPNVSSDLEARLKEMENEYLMKYNKEQEEKYKDNLEKQILLAQTGSKAHLFASGGEDGWKPVVDPFGNK